MPFTRSVNRKAREPLVQLLVRGEPPSAVQTIVYEVMSEPPSSGAIHSTRIDRSDIVRVGADGVEGLVEGVPSTNSASEVDCSKTASR